MDKPYEICLSQRGHELRLPPLEDKANALWLGKIMAELYPEFLVEIAHDGMRSSARSENAANAKSRRS